MLTGGALQMTNDVTVTGPVAGGANVRSNSTFVGNNVIRVNGDVVASGTNNLAGTCPNSRIDGQCLQNESRASLPTMTAYSVYRSLSSPMSGSWYDLCPDGTVRRPDPARSTPCTGSLASAVTPYDGWSLATRQRHPDLDLFRRRVGDCAHLLRLLGQRGPRRGCRRHHNCDGGGGCRRTRRPVLATRGKHRLAVRERDRFRARAGDGGRRRPGGQCPGVCLARHARRGGPHPLAELHGDTDRRDRFAAGKGGTLSASPRSELDGNISLTFDDSANVPVASVLRTTSWLELSGQ